MKLINITFYKRNLVILSISILNTLCVLFIIFYKKNTIEDLNLIDDSTQWIENQDIEDMMTGQNFMNICLNKQIVRNDIAVWTLLADEVENYGIGAIKLLKSIRKNVKTTKFDSFVLELVNKPIKPKRMRDEILKAGWRICQVNRIAPRDENKTRNLFRDTFTALILWNATDYKAHYHFDSDMLVLRNIDDLFSIHTKFDSDIHKMGCTRDWRENKWQETFNMGAFVVKPNQTEFNRLIELKNDPNFHYEMIMSQQGFLNVVYKNRWYEIGFENSANLVLYVANRDFWNEKEKFINIIHYTMQKPWSCSEKVYKKQCDLWRRFN